MASDIDIDIDIRKKLLLKNTKEQLVGSLLNAEEINDRLLEQHIYILHKVNKELGSLLGEVKSFLSDPNPFIPK